MEINKETINLLSKLEKICFKNDLQMTLNSSGLFVIPKDNPKFDQRNYISLAELNNKKLSELHNKLIQ